MSVFNRIAGTEEPKIAVWPIMMDISRVMDGRQTFADLAAKHDLDADEQARMGLYMTKLEALVAAEVAERTRIGMGQAFAQRDGRLAIDGLLRYLLLQAEQGVLTEDELDAALGIE